MIGLLAQNWDQLLNGNNTEEPISFKLVALPDLRERTIQTNNPLERVSSSLTMIISSHLAYLQ